MKVYRVDRLLRVGILILIISMLSGCGWIGGKSESGNENTTNKTTEQKVDTYTGEKSREITYVYTAKKELSLTFNGMGDKETMTKLLDELDKYGIKATFFLPGMRVAEEPDIANDIVARGHEIENNTLNQLDLTNLDYQQIYKEIKLSNEVIEKETGKRPKYVRSKSGDHSDDLLLVTAQLGMKAVVSYNINPKDRDMKSAKEIGDYVKRYISRGGIITLNTDINPEVISSIQYIASAAKEIGYKLITLDELVENGGVRKPLEQIPGYDASKFNNDYENADYELIYKVNTKKRHIALTFDDFGSDKTVTEILDILAEHDVKVTFFLRAKGVEDNPNLARAMVAEGHEVANHTYAHSVSTTITPEELQEDVVKAHQVITEAIQEQPVMLFRPPTGVIDDERAKAVAAVGYPVIAMYDVTTLDWDVSNTADDIVNKIMEKTENGSVILLHMLDNIHTIEALPRVLDGLEDKGFTFVKMSELIKEQDS
ncbi:Peptidoglycan/xylan/chitin deacetylase, PgdA/CDA1 family [Fontibacillus panacisegetis]|uniref:Peptidoglycan/xylan/chitin deacetylase, PgdA/CDA1 family n=1 Tax=Fontibacillus panacisegetis TaxID=670482 RepID=A0A1G7NX48_9BACL|nr:polysaccharide deacetylase family protein [Fontibacillus panacisegetis]SDF78616.1 Peptidoglycan/xylan/chitin deacetylase, PgdA/CDA1 family [Fontibacillus panacisegetis]